MDSDFSKSDLNLILDIIHRSLTCRNREEFVALVDTTKTLVDFSHLRSVFGDCSEYETKKMGAFKMVTEFPKEWEVRYNQKNYVLYDNIATTAFRQSGLIYWADYARLKDVDSSQNKISKKIMKEGRFNWIETGLALQHARMAII